MMMEADSLPPRKRAAIRRRLLAWFSKHARDLPWRRTKDPYRIWVSEIMLQQTRVEAVAPYYQRFRQAFPSVRALASAHEDRVLKLWEGLGYYTRARNLHRASKIIVQERRGRFPRSAEGWRELPGIGRYTAGAIASIAFGERAPVLDGNVKRVLARLFRIEAPIEDAATERLFWTLAEELVPPKRPGDFNQAMMELGARICLPKRPRCEECLLSKQCEAFAAGRQSELPRRREKKAARHHNIVVGVIEKNGRYLLGKRPAHGLLAGLWEFPGGKVEPGEAREEALKRELEEELGVRIAIGAPVATVDHAYSHYAVTLHVYRCRILRGRPRARHHSEIRWVSRKEFERHALPAANLKFLDRL
ncbi:MAG: A/G-specific adenine glycosylase [Candidatus Sumerlaeota bacterium]|nr:A/G-specific adenine glycosylase [Candidatus Sumerlaeota bacterium]